jgi:hypothetical protein
MQQFLDGIDFSMLRDQRAALIELINDMARGSADTEDIQHFAGILALLDHITDVAADSGMNPPLLAGDDEEVA